MNQEKRAWWDEALSSFQTKLGYTFRNIDLLEEALTHSSYAHESGLSYCNERLEFLGDAVLELCVSQVLFLNDPSSDEGRLTRTRSNLVCRSALSEWASTIELPQLIRLGKGLARSRNKDPFSHVMGSLSADAMEAVLGAIFVDGGYPAALPVIENYVKINSAQEGREVFIDPKSRLQSLAQEMKLGQPAYLLSNVSGEDHMPNFEVFVRVGSDIIGRGTGPSRKAAEFEAASDGLKYLAN